MVCHTHTYIYISKNGVSYIYIYINEVVKYEQHKLRSYETFQQDLLLINTAT